MSDKKPTNKNIILRCCGLLSKDPCDAFQKTLKTCCGLKQCNGSIIKKIQGVTKKND